MLNSKANIKNDSLNSLKIISSNSNELVVSYEKNKLEIEKIISFLGSQNVKINDITTDDGDLEDVFIKLTKN